MPPRNPLVLPKAIGQTTAIKNYDSGVAQKIPKTPELTPEQQVVTPPKIEAQSYDTTLSGTQKLISGLKTQNDAESKSLASGSMSALMSALQSTGGSVGKTAKGGKGVDYSSYAAGAPNNPVSGNGSGADSIVNVGKKYIGVPYVAGGRTPKSGMDCSGYTAYVL